MNARRVHELLLDAKKAVGVLTVMEGAAVGYGLLSGPVPGIVTGVLGVAATGVTYLLANEDAPTPDGKGSR